MNSTITELATLMDQIAAHILTSLEMVFAMKKTMLPLATLMEEIVAEEIEMMMVTVNILLTIECVDMMEVIAALKMLILLVMVFAMMKTTLANVPSMVEIVA